MQLVSLADKVDKGGNLIDTGQTLRDSIDLKANDAEVVKIDGSAAMTAPLRFTPLTDPTAPVITNIGTAGTGAVAEVDSLNITAAPTADGNVAVGLNGVSVNVAVTIGAAEVSSLVITGTVTTAGSVDISLNGVITSVAVALNDTNVQVADKIRAAAFTGWTTGGTAATDTVTFTSNTVGVKTDTTYAIGTSAGATGVVTTTTQGVDADTTTTVATKIRGTAFTGWTTSGTATNVIFTSDTTGDKTDATYSAGTTGATGTITTTTQGKADTTATYNYYIVAEDSLGRKTLVSPVGSTATGNATLSATNYNKIDWTAVVGAVKYYVLKGTTGTLLGISTTNTLNDIGQTTSIFTPPTRNTTVYAINNNEAVVKGQLDLKQDLITYTPANDAEVVKSVTGSAVDNTDSQNPIVNISIAPEPTAGQTVVYKDTYADFPTTGSIDTLYVDNEKGVIYTWNVDLADYLKEGGTQIQTDWNEGDNTSPAYIRNKPNINASFKPLIIRVTVAANTTIVLPLEEGFVYDFTVDWGDGTPLYSINEWPQDHLFINAGTYDIKIKGKLGCFRFSPLTDITTRNSVVEVVSWGDIVWNVVRFGDCANLTTLPAAESPNLINVTDLTYFIEYTGVTVLPPDLLRHAINVTSFRGFAFGSPIATIPADFLSYCYSAINFTNAFWRCSLTAIPSGLFRNCLNARTFIQTFKENALQSVPTDLFDYCEFAEDFTSCFSDNDILTFPNGIHKFNLRTVAHVYEFRFSDNMAGAVDPLWLRNPELSGSNFITSTLVTNLAEIPTAWGGTFVGTYTKYTLKEEGYWDTATDQPVWLINGVWKTAAGGQDLSGKLDKQTNIQGFWTGTAAEHTAQNIEAQTNIIAFIEG